MNNKIKPVHGKVYYLHTTHYSGFCFWNHDESFYGLYIGLNPVETNWFMRIKGPEGHTFVRQAKNGELEAYCTRYSKDFEMKYEGDLGDDEPAYPIGIHVDKVEYEFSKEERKYLLERLKAKYDIGELKNVA